MFLLDIQSISSEGIAGPQHVIKILHSLGHMPVRSSILYKQTDKKYISWKT